jgi:hypothetical protein
MARIAAGTRGRMTERNAFRITVIGLNNIGRIPVLVLRAGATPKANDHSDVRVGAVGDRRRRVLPHSFAVDKAARPTAPAPDPSPVGLQQLGKA